jgi:stage IV sporulation protein FB
MTVEIQGENEGVVKPVAEQTAPTKNNWWATLLSLFVYIAVYYAFFKSFRHIFLLIAVILIHEGGHYLAMKIFGYRDIRLFFIPLLGAFVSGSSNVVTPFQRSLMILAGPIPGIFIGMILFSLFAVSGNYFLFEAAMLFLLLNAFNLLPFTPLDGGQLLQTIYFRTNYTVQTLFIVLSIIIICIFSYTSKKYFLLLLIVLLIMRLKRSYQINQLRKKVTAQAIKLDKSYSALSDAEYQAIRKVLLKLYPEWDIPYDPSADQEKEIAALIQVLVPGSSSGTISITQKSYLTLLWLAGLVVPLFALVHYFNNLR